MAHGLNSAQEEAVAANHGPLLVLAGAGTGKTRVVTYRIARLVRSGVAAERILAVTFTNKAAREMQQRISELLGKKTKGSARPEISTFHSLCVRVLRRQIERLGYPAKFAIYDQGDQESLARSVLREIQVGEAQLRPGDLLAYISKWKSAGLRPEAVSRLCRTDKEHLASMAYRRYQSAIKAFGAVDFDDLLLLTEEVFTKFENARREEAGRFDFILVDEYQDTNAPQYRIIKTLAAQHRNLCVVGDDDQSIYSWRGAEVSHILRFKVDWPDAKVVRLEDNYRCTSAILEWANRLIQFNKTRHDKSLRSEKEGETPRVLQFKNEQEEAKGIVREIADRMKKTGQEARDFAILFRTNQQPRVFETELRAAKIPYNLIGGSSFYDRKEVKDLLAYMKVVINPRDETSLRRIINTPPRGIGTATASLLGEYAVKTKTPFWELLRSPPTEIPLTTASRTALAKFVQLIEHFALQLKKEPKRLSETLTNLISASHYEQELARLYTKPEDRESRSRNVQEVVNALAEHEQQSEQAGWFDFVDAMSLGDIDVGADKEKALKGNAVALLTLHAAKGLEFPEVYLVGMEEGVLPHHRSLGEMEQDIDEERRLCYVGVTRARERLTLSLPLTRLKWGKPRDSIPSRFLYELMGKADHPNAARVRRGQLPARKST